ncbi:hypothetical protein AMECASPLE_025729 [Ameca splendens]|uniref:Uncharacterized protein n=1 Tax=Ameca splendens TaxID=208324 RepID=A0ABV0ZEB5_9TELE
MKQHHEAVKLSSLTNKNLKKVWHSFTFKPAEPIICRNNLSVTAASLLGMPLPALHILRDLTVLLYKITQAYSDWMESICDETIDVSLGFGSFLRRAIHLSIVPVFQGHRGAGVYLQLSLDERRVTP